MSANHRNKTAFKNQLSDQVDSGIIKNISNNNNTKGTNLTRQSFDDQDESGQQANGVKMLTETAQLKAPDVKVSNIIGNYSASHSFLCGR